MTVSSSQQPTPLSVSKKYIEQGYKDLLILIYRYQISQKPYPHQ
jgi:hypothetical protein